MAAAELASLAGSKVGQCMVEDYTESERGERPLFVSRLLLATSSVTVQQKTHSRLLSLLLFTTLKCALICSKDIIIVIVHNIILQCYAM